MYGYYSRVVSNQKQVIMARIRYRFYIYGMFATHSFNNFSVRNKPLTEVICGGT